MSNRRHTIWRWLLFGAAALLAAAAVALTLVPEKSTQVAVQVGRLATERWPGLLLLLAASLLAAVGAGLRADERRRSTAPPALPLPVHVTLLLGMAAVLAAAAGALLWSSLGQPALTGVRSLPATPTPPSPAAAPVGGWTVANTFDAIKIVLAVVAGVGGVVALTVAYRRQHLGETGEHREDTKLFADRFAKAAELLGSDKAAVRLAGVYAVAALADDWLEGRQTCIDVLCAYLRMPYTPPDAETTLRRISWGPIKATLRGRLRQWATPTGPSDAGPIAGTTAGASAVHEADRERREQREVRHTILRLIRDHLQPAEDPRSWRGRHLDFTGAVFDGGDLSGVTFDGGTVSFRQAKFLTGIVSFDRAVFAGAQVDFEGAVFSGSTVLVTNAQFDGGTVSFQDAEFCAGMLNLAGSFRGAMVSFDQADFLPGGRVSVGWHFAAGTVDFGAAEFRGATVTIRGAPFQGGTVNLATPGALEVPPRFLPAIDFDNPPPGVHLPASGWPVPHDTAKPGSTT